MIMIVRMVINDVIFALTRMLKDVDKTGEEAKSAIIVSICQLLPKSSSLVSDHMSNLIASTEAEPKVYSILCGSFAEFYIRPLNPCISDIHFLICRNTTLLFNGDLPVLPTDISGLSDRIWCSKISRFCSITIYRSNALQL